MAESMNPAPPGGGGPPNGAAASNGPPPEALPQAVRLYNELVQERSTLRRMRVVSSLTLLAIFVVYMLFIGLRISKFSKDKFGSALQQKILDLRPEIRDTITQAVEENKDLAWMRVRQTAETCERNSQDYYLACRLHLF